MFGTKVSQFIKNRYLVQPQNAVQPLQSELNRDDTPFVAAPAPEFAPEPIENVVSELPEQPELVMEPVSVPEPVTGLDPVLNEYDRSKLGRTFGWWVCIDGQCVASLEYCCLLEEVVHLYKVTVLDDAFLLIDLDSEKWLGSNVTIQSRYAEDYIKPGLSMAAVGQNMIVVENLVIPEKYFRLRYQELEEFHHKLVEKAHSKAR